MKRAITQANTKKPSANSTAYSRCVFSMSFSWFRQSKICLCPSLSTFSIRRVAARITSVSLAKRTRTTTTKRGAANLATKSNPIPLFSFSDFLPSFLVPVLELPPLRAPTTPLIIPIEAMRDRNQLGSCGFVWPVPALNISRTGEGASNTSALKLVHTTT